MSALFPLIIINIIIIVVILYAINKSSNTKIQPYNQVNPARLTKSQSNRVFSGVCGGIADHFGWSPTIVRLFFIFSGAGILTYFVLAIAIPDSDSPLL